MSSGTVSPRYTISENTDGTGNLDIKDPVLFRFVHQLMTQQIAIVKLVNISQPVPSSFFQKIVDEINKAYSSGLYTSTWVCLRKLFENLLIELLRRKYGTARVEIYFNTAESRFNDFSVLITNLSNNVRDFSSYTSGFDQSFFNFLSNFREQANRTAHSIDIIEDFQRIEKLANLINQYCDLICGVIGKI